jgi:hypothetical protein
LTPGVDGDGDGDVDSTVDLAPGPLVHREPRRDAATGSTSTWGQTSTYRCAAVDLDGGVKVNVNAHAPDL